MDTFKYIVKRLLLAVVILLGVSVIIYVIARLMPVDYFDQQYASALSQGTMKRADLDHIKDLYGLNMPDAYLDARIGESEGGESHEFAGKRFRRNVHDADYKNLVDTAAARAEWYAEDVFTYGKYRIGFSHEGDKEQSVYGSWILERVVSYGDSTEENGEEGGDLGYSGTRTERVDAGTFTVNGDYSVTLVSDNGGTYTLSMRYSVAGFWDKTGAIIGGYFRWIGNLIKGDLGTSFKYKKPVADVILQNMGISFGISLVATLLEFLIAIPLGIKAATNQYGFIDYTVTVLTMIGISLPTFFLGAIVIRVFSTGGGLIPIFPPSGLTGSMSFGANWLVQFADILWHMVLPMFVLVILSVGSLMRYTRTNTLEVLNADYIRTARAKGLSERAVIYKHAFRNTMIPLVTLMAGILPSLFGGAMITEQVFGIPGIGKLAYDALIVADIPFIMGYNMFLAIMTVIGTLLSDLMYAVVDPRVKLTK